MISRIRRKITKYVLKEPNSFEYEGCVVAVEAASRRWNTQNENETSEYCRRMKNINYNAIFIMFDVI